MDVLLRFLCHKHQLLLMLRSALLSLCLVSLAHAAAPLRPNVLFIAVDDLNDWVGHLGGHAQARTPNIDRLAASGVAFSRAYAASPVCNPSRAATLTGLRPGTSGVYHNHIDWREHIPLGHTLPAAFRQAGYRTIGAGKIFHDEFNEIAGVWHEWRPFSNKDPVPPPGVSPGVGTIRFGPVNEGDEAMQDHQLVSWLIERLQRPAQEPFFMACGIYRPHFPLYVPRPYFQRHPLESVRLPLVLDTDWDDLPPSGRFYARNFASDGVEAARSTHDEILESGRWREVVQAYLASIAFADAQVGRLLDALERSPYRDSTIVVLWSDHGFHLGEKLHWRKTTLWEEGTRVPLIWRVPGLTPSGRACLYPVDLMSIYPTLLDLCGISKPPHVEGENLRPLLANPLARWEHPALTTAREQDHAVRTARWRYIRYRDGGEELYDTQIDPHEWSNLAGRPEHAATKAELARLLPQVNRATLPTWKLGGSETGRRL